MTEKEADAWRARILSEIPLWDVYATRHVIQMSHEELERLHRLYLDEVDRLMKERGWGS